MKAEGTDVRAGRHSECNTAWEEKSMMQGGCGQIPLALSGQSPEGIKSRFLIRDNDRKLISGVWRIHF